MAGEGAFVPLRARAGAVLCALRALDAESCAACLSALDADVWRDLSALGLSNARPASVIAEKTGDYGALAAWLAGASYESIEKRAH